MKMFKGMAPFCVACNYMRDGLLQKISILIQIHFLS